MNKIRIIQSSFQDNEFIIVFSPEVISVNKELNNFIELHNNDRKITIKMDLIIFVGNRPERFIQMDIKNSKIVNNTIKKGIIDNETERETINAYSKLPINLINRIYPVSYREKIINRNEDTPSRVSF